MMLSLLAQMLMLQPTNAICDLGDVAGLKDNAVYEQCVVTCITKQSSFTLQGETDQHSDKFKCAQQKAYFECLDNSEGCKACGFAQCMDSDQLEAKQKKLNDEKKKYKDDCKDDTEYLLCHAAPVTRVGLLVLLALW